MTRVRRSPRLPAQLVPAGQAPLDAGEELAGLHVTGVEGSIDGPGAELSGCRLSGLWLIGADLTGCRIVDAVFERCDLSMASLVRASLTRVVFSDCRLTGASLSDTHLVDVAFEGCRMDEVELRIARAEWLDLVDSDLHDADFYGAALPGARVLRCNLRGADCSASSWTGAWLHGSDLAGLKGAGALAHTTIGSEQIVPLALGVFIQLGITVDDDPADRC